MTGSRFNTSLFDKLTAGAQFSSAKTADANARGILESLREFITPNADQFGEGPLRDAIRRDVSWLLNTASLEAAIDLTNYPQVATSVLNFGVPELAGKATNTASIQSRARQIHTALTVFEPRLDSDTLLVEPREGVLRENAVTYSIVAELNSPQKAAPVQFLTDVEADTGSVTVRT